MPAIEVDGDSSSAWDAEVTLICDAFPGGVDAWLATYAEGAPASDLAAIVAASEALGSDVVHELATLQWFRDACPPDPQVVAEARAEIAAVAASLAATRAETAVDAFVFLTTQCPAPPLGAGATDLCSGDDFTPAILLAALCGWPEVTVPGGFSAGGLPVAISFLGPPRSEATLLRFAFAYDLAARHRKQPRASADVE